MKRLGLAFIVVATIVFLSTMSYQVEADRPSLHTPGEKVENVASIKDSFLNPHLLIFKRSQTEPILMSILKPPH